MHLPSNSNQARGLAEFAAKFMNNEIGNNIDPSVLERVEMFHTDSVCCGLSALALQTNAPTVLRNEALEYTTQNGATVFGSDVKVKPEKV